MTTINAALLAMETNVDPIIVRLLMIRTSVVVVDAEDEDEEDDDDDEDDRDGRSTTAIDNDAASTTTTTTTTSDVRRRRRTMMERLIEVRRLLVDLREALGGVIRSIEDVGPRDVATTTTTTATTTTTSTTATKTRAGEGVRGGGGGGGGGGGRMMMNSGGKCDYDTAMSMTTTMTRGSIVRRSTVIVSVLCDVLRWEGAMGRYRPRRPMSSSSSSSSSSLSSSRRIAMEAMTTNATPPPPPPNYPSSFSSCHDAIRRSTEYACVEGAASCLALLWRALSSSALSTSSSRRRMLDGTYYYDDDDDDCGNPTDGIVADVARAIVLPTLVSCAVALATLECVPSGPAGDRDRGCEYEYDDRGDNGGGGDEKWGPGGNRRALDTGEDCAVAILSCIRSLLVPVRCDDDDGVDKHDDDDDDDDDDDRGGNSSTQRRLRRRCGGRERYLMNDDDDDDDDARDGSTMTRRSRLIASEVGRAMNGALVARLVEGCLSLLLPRSGKTRQDAEGTAARNDAHPAMEGGGDDNAALQLESLRTLRSLMSGVPSSALWRTMLPGCFAGLYRYALSRLRNSSSGSSSSHNGGTAESVRALAVLLELTLSVDETRRVTTTTSNDDAAASLMAAVAAHRRLSLSESELPNTDDDPMATDLEEEEEEEEEGGRGGGRGRMKMREFKTEVNDRLIGPISVLLSVIPNVAAASGRHSRTGIKLRDSGLRLCWAVMNRDVRSFWTESNRRTLERKSLEYCFMTLADEEEAEDALSRRCASEVVNAYKSYYHDGDGTIASRWRAHMSAVIVPTILELIDALPAFAKSGREMHVRHHLRLIDGYLMLSFRDNGNDNYFNLQKIKGKKSDIGSALSCAAAVNTIKESFSETKRPWNDHFWEWLM
ncbi:hypothetical protein ACHAXA_001053 [Cyclostephanos tholiformis]|uniref:Uncharacterized protein n=1 Tax=Cyclostephanos tholiformis TaxID=382380 RepID=A0ABD3RCJ6_9STRA